MKASLNFSFCLLLISILHTHFILAELKISMARKEAFSFTIPEVKEETTRNKVVVKVDSSSTSGTLQPLGKNFMGVYFEQNFDKAMLGTDKDEHEYNNFLLRTSDKKFITTLKNQYAIYIEELEQLYAQTPRIPKIIHQIWVGPHPFPSEARAWQASWMRLHPDWEYKLWTNEDVETLDFENKIFYDQAQNWGEKADILRYEVLYRFGGVYADIDQSCLKPMDILHHTCDFYTGIHALPLITIKCNNKLRIANGVIGCTPGHPIMYQMVHHIKHERAHHNLLARTGPDYFTKIINQVFESSVNAGNKDVILPANYFYPCAKRKYGKFKIESNAQVYVKPETFGVQYYTSYWVTPPTH